MLLTHLATLVKMTHGTRLVTSGYQKYRASLFWNGMKLYTNALRLRVTVRVSSFRLVSR